MIVGVAEVDAKLWLGVAVATATPSQSLASTSATPTIIVLDGTFSTGAANLTYTWAQTAGAPLNLPASAMNKDRIGLRIFKSGKYTFQLTVSDGTSSSAPTAVDVLVK